MTPCNIQKFQKNLLLWFERHGRQGLPWQLNPSPYHIWLSEVMLQQTQVATVIPYFQKFLNAFPTIKALANASLDEVLALWAGLGYYARARNLHKTSQLIMSHHQGQFPEQFDALIGLPGIGRSTAGAILSFAFHQSYPILDGNIKRVLTRHQTIAGWPGHSHTQKQLWTLAEVLTPKKAHVRAFNQAMMDLGALVCTKSKPACAQCPVQINCQAYQTNTIHQYPEKKTKTLKPSRIFNFVAALCNGQVLIEQRPQHGIWGGLWSLPILENSKPKAIRDWLCSIRGNTTARIFKISPFTHSLTHFNMEIHTTLCHVPKLFTPPDHLHWHPLTATHKGFPRPIQNILSICQNTP